MTLTKNFTLEELAPHDKVAVLKNKLVLANLQELAQTLQSIRDYYGKPMRITSGYRSPEYNKQIGGSSTSQHTTGLAADIKPMDGNMADLKRAILQWAKSHKFDQIILEQMDKNGIPAWIHLGTRHHLLGQRRQYLTAKKVNGVWKYAKFVNV